MIRRVEKKDYEKIMEIWKNSNIKAHDFRDKGNWIGN